MKKKRKGRICRKRNERVRGDGILIIISITVSSITTI